MSDISIFSWIARPIISIVRLVWTAVRIRDGSIVTLGSIGDTEDSRPEFLYIGLHDTELTCLVRLYVTVMNKGRAPVRNLAVRVQLPKKLVADVPLQRANPESSDSFYTISPDERSIVLNFESSLRIDEGAGFPILLRIRPTDWTEVKAGGPQKRQGNLVLSDYRAGSLVRVVALQMKVAVQADNIRGISREWDIWLTPAKSWAELKDLSSVLTTIQRIWNIGLRAFLFPFLGSAVWMPSLRGRYQPGTLIYLKSDEYTSEPEVARFFDIAAAPELLPMEVYRRLAANPGGEGKEFRDWVRSIKQAKPNYYG